MFTIRGGRELRGEVTVSGAKNSVLPILAATILNGGESVLHNCPDLKDVSSAIEILRHLGCAVRREGTTLRVDSSDIVRCDVPLELMQQMRSSVIFLGPILARCGKAVLTAPGGCELGPRPIDLHIKGLETLGAEIMSRGQYIECVARDMRGDFVDLPFPSVGATENVMLAATACRGTTVITGAAREPEVEDLGNFLRACGAVISGLGTDRVTIEGGDIWGNVEYRIMPDRIETATYLCAVGACGGEIKISDCRPSHITSVIWPMRRAGMEIEIGRGEIVARASGLSAVPVTRTMPYPGFPTDAMPTMMAMCCRSAGTSVFYEQIFENRFRHVPALRAMGADITVSGRMASVNGVGSLHGAEVDCTDLRGGMALLIAAAAAEGESKIGTTHHVDRGYEHIERKLSQLGVDITRGE